MAAVRNFLFIMCDQLRADHLGCYGHPYLATRNLDLLARRGVRFERAFVRLVEDGDAQELGHQHHLGRLARLGYDHLAGG